MRCIIVSGSVAAGKTTVARALAKKLRAQYVDVKKILVRHKEVVAGYDRKRKTKEVDVRKLNAVLIKLIKHAKKTLVIDSHLSHYLPKKYVDLCVICKCGLPELQRRLRKRKYDAAKIRENLDAEIFDVCLVEALERGHKVEVVYTDQDWRKQLKKISFE